MRSVLASAVLACLLSCGATDDSPQGADTADTPECTAPLPVRLVVVDPWGRPLPDATLTPASDTEGPQACLGVFPPADLCLPEGEFAITVAAPGFNTATGTVTTRPAHAEGFAYVTQATGTTATGCLVTYLFVALEHPWFADSGAPPERNHATFFHCGEPMYARLAEDLQQATQSVRVATWWWQSRFELQRPEATHLTLTPEERFGNTAMGLLEQLTGVDIRVLVGRFAGDTATGMAYVNTDTALREKAYALDDGFEVILQGNPTPVPVFDDFVPPPYALPLAQRIRETSPVYTDLSFSDTETVALALEQAEAASWHQKTWVLDDRITYISGMNVKSTDWDTPQHRVFEPRRMKFQSSPEERAAVADHQVLPDLGPRKDSGLRLVGPAAADVARILQARWTWGQGRKDLFAELTTPFPDPMAAPPHPDGVLTQVVATLPAPFNQRSIREVHEKAIAQATDLIFIEDQYWRVPLLLPVLAQALAASPELHIVVVTKPVSALDGAKQWTLYMDQELRALAGERYLLLQLKSFDAVGLADGSSGPLFLPIDVHTKLMFVDDRFLTLGSANKNNRGLLYEGELNAAILDQAFVRSARQSFLANLTGDSQTDWGTLPGADIAKRLAEQAATNAAREAAWLEGSGPSPPEGFIYPLAFTTDYYIDVGPDAF